MQKLKQIYSVKQIRKQRKIFHRKYLQKSTNWFQRPPPDNPLTPNPSPATHLSKGELQVVQSDEMECFSVFYIRCVSMSTILLVVVMNYELFMGFNFFIYYFLVCF